MVGIVIVSHSFKVADGIKDLAMQMAGSDQKIITAGGMEDGTIGTDAVKISHAIQEAHTGEGVVVLVDLGSAVLSSNMALELINTDIAKEVLIADAPVLEGAISASVQAAIGGNLQEVLEAAELARSVLKI